MSKVRNYLLEEVLNRSIPGFAYLIGRRDEILEQGHGGYKSVLPVEEPMEDNVIYDVASLTKPFVTATLFMKLHEEKLVRLEEKIEYYLPEMRTISKGNITALDLLTHSSGITAWHPMFVYGESLEEYLDAIAGMELEYAVRTKVNYSCIGYMIVAGIIEKVTGSNVESLFRELIAGKLKLRDTFIHSRREDIQRIAPTEQGSEYEKEIAESMGKQFNKWRNYLMRGEVHDCNAYYAGGQTGNSGLFSNTTDLFSMAQIFLEEDLFFKGSTLKLFFTVKTYFSDEHWSISWKHGSSKDATGAPLGERAVGHSGFTGTSLWLEPEAKNVYILLTNRVHPRVTNVDMNQIRRNFHLQCNKMIKGRNNE